MAFQIPTYHGPDFTQQKFKEAPDVKIAVADMDGVAPDYYHSTSMSVSYTHLSTSYPSLSATIRSLSHCTGE